MSDAIQNLPNNARKAADSIIQNIKAGIYKPEVNIPSVRKLSESFDINRQSTWLALKALEETGWISIQGNGRYRISENIEEKVFNNLIVTMVVNGDNHIYFPGHQSFFFGLRDKLRAVGSDLRLQIYNPRNDEIDLEFIRESDVVILVGEVTNVYHQIKDYSLKMIGVNVDYCMTEAFIINSDSFESGQQAAYFAKEKDVQKAVVIGYQNIKNWIHTNLRYEGFKHIWLESGKPESAMERIIIEEERNNIVDLKRLQETVESRTDVELFFCLDERSSIAVTNSLQIAGVDIPNQSKVIGYDLTDHSRYSHTMISGFEQDFLKMSEIAFQVIQGDIQQASPIKVPIDLIHRETT